MCHGDLWAPHIYFVGAEFSGFVDYERLTLATPAFDLAQVILHFNGWQSREAVIAAYDQRHLLNPEDKALLPAAAILDLAGEAYWSSDMLYDGAHAQRDKTAYMTNLKSLLESLEFILS